jgi:hypothetical protein
MHRGSKVRRSALARDLPRATTSDRIDASGVHENFAVTIAD